MPNGIVYHRRIMYHIGKISTRMLGSRFPRMFEYLVMYQEDCLVCILHHFFGTFLQKDTEESHINDKILSDDLI